MACELLTRWTSLVVGTQLELSRLKLCYVSKVRIVYIADVYKDPCAVPSS
jgi:hypothetical protein